MPDPRRPAGAARRSNRQVVGRGDRIHDGGGRIRSEEGQAERGAGAAGRHEGVREQPDDGRAAGAASSQRAAAAAAGEERAAAAAAGEESTELRRAGWERT
jgi:hypothetical protein